MAKHEDAQYFKPPDGYLSSTERIKMQKSISIPNFFDVVANMCLPEEYAYGCLYSFEVDWDQWARCTLICEHGKYVGVSDYLNITEAMVRATVAFRNDPVHKEYPETPDE